VAGNQERTTVCRLSVLNCAASATERVTVEHNKMTPHPPGPGHKLISLSLHGSRTWWQVGKQNLRSSECESHTPHTTQGTVESSRAPNTVDSHGDQRAKPSYLSRSGTPVAVRSRPRPAGAAQRPGNAATSTWAGGQPVPAERAPARAAIHAHPRVVPGLRS
jgi:hypothetical protein